MCIFVAIINLKTMAEKKDVEVPGTDSEDVVLRISKPRFEYIRTKLLHLTQQNQKYTDK